eukprot:70562_1
MDPQVHAFDPYLWSFPSKPIAFCIIPIHKTIRNRSVFASYRSAIPSFRSISVLISIATDRLLDHTDPQNHRFDPNLWLFPSKPYRSAIPSFRSISVLISIATDRLLDHTDPQNHRFDPNLWLFPSKSIGFGIVAIHKTILLIQICGYFHGNRSVFDCFWMALDP